MNLPFSSIHKLIDSLTRSNASFALYRQPWTDEPLLVLQEAGGAQTVDGMSGLNGKRGFLMAPFKPGGKHPIVLIEADHCAHGWESISDLLAQYAQTHAAEIPAPPAGPLQPSAGQEPGQETGGQDQEAYAEAFGRFIVPLRQNTFQKLVLSRCLHRKLPEGFSPLSTFVNACNSYPRMMISLAHTPATGTWIGSTPEIILSGHDTQWHTVSLAGTMPMQGDTMPDEWSEKNRKEQAFVSEYIRKTVKQFGSKITEKGPYTARAGGLVHLKTDFSFQLKDTSRLGDILNELHPTPAVCGLPKQEAYAFIEANEGIDRKYYAGIIGWLDPQGDTSLYVNLRCMKVEGSESTLYAGGGILPSSVLEAEWEETRQKLNTMLNVL